MELLCPSGHQSSASDFCSECGLEIQAAAGSAAPSAPPVAVTTSVASKEHCPMCQTERDTHAAEFCGVCGYNFITKTGGETLAADLHAAPAQPSSQPRPVSSAPQSGARMDVKVSVNLGKAGAPHGVPDLTFSLFDEENLIGRRSSSVPQSLPIDNDGAISKRQALIIRQSDGIYTIRDLNSTNGTFVNGQEVKTGTERSLKEGDVISVGEFTSITVVSIKKA